MKVILITFLMIVLALPVFADNCDRCHSKTPLQYNALEIAYKYEGLTELTNKNDGPEITQWLKNVGLGPGYPYCAAFMYSMYKESRDFLNIDAVLPYRSARVSSIYYAAKNNPVKYKVMSQNEVALGVYKLEPGDIPVWTTSGDSVTNFNGHTGLVIEQLDSKRFRSIEGNTRSGTAGDQREGGGVFIRTRLIKNFNFKIKGFIRLKDNK